MVVALSVFQAFLVALAGLGFVCLVTAVFVLIAKLLAPLLLGDHDGSS